MPSKKTKTSSHNIGLKIDNNICFDKQYVQKNSTNFILLWLQNWARNYLKVSINLEKKFVENFYRSKGIKPNSYSFSIVSENKVLKYLKSLSVNKATGLDDIPSRL